jgi:hypothetical protein
MCMGDGARPRASACRSGVPPGRPCRLLCRGVPWRGVAWRARACARARPRTACAVARVAAPPWVCCVRVVPARRAWSRKAARGWHDCGRDPQEAVRGPGAVFAAARCAVLCCAVLCCAVLCCAVGAGCVHACVRACAHPAVCSCAAANHVWPAARCAPAGMLPLVCLPSRCAHDRRRCRRVSRWTRCATCLRPLATSWTSASCRPRRTTPWVSAGCGALRACV